MHDLMLGMFWGGLFMALPPLLVGGAIVALLRKAHREAEQHRPDPRS